MRIACSPCLLLFAVCLGWAGELAGLPAAVPAAPTGSVEERDARMADFFAPDARLEVLASGFTWSEGPVWIESEDALLFSDVPENVIWRWSESEGLAPYLRPSGHTGETEEGREGSNGLAVDPNGRLVICQHGDRRIVWMDAPIEQPAPDFVTLIATFEGARLNSPNDLVFNSRGDLWFTDPPYGLRGSDEQEASHAGVYRLSRDGHVTLVEGDLPWPNGIGLSPDESVLYVAHSDHRSARYFAYNLDENGQAIESRELLDVTELVGPANPGIPDGLAIHPSGTLFATGPGGVLVIAPDGTHLGTIRTERSAANCAFDSEFRALYITAGADLLRILLKE